MELSCHPTSGLVLPDNSPLQVMHASPRFDAYVLSFLFANRTQGRQAHYGACTRKTCHTDSLDIQDGYTEPVGQVVVGTAGDSKNLKLSVKISRRMIRES